MPGNPMSLTICTVRDPVHIGAVLGALTAQGVNGPNEIHLVKVFT